jgi:hypothetical protein
MHIRKHKHRWEESTEINLILFIPGWLLAILHSTRFLNVKISSTSQMYAYYMFRPTLVIFRCLIKLLMKQLYFRPYVQSLGHALIYVPLCPTLWIVPLVVSCVAVMNEGINKLCATRSYDTTLHKSSSADSTVRDESSPLSRLPTIGLDLCSQKGYSFRHIISQKKTGKLC